MHITSEHLHNLTIFQLETLKHQCDVVIAQKKKTEFVPGANVTINDTVGTWLVEKLEEKTFIARKILPIGGKLGLPYRYTYDQVSEIVYESKI